MIFKKVKRCVIAALLILSPFSGFSLQLNPYLGFDQQLNRMRFKEGYGHNLFPKHYPQVNVYAGIKFLDPYGLEFGYISTASKHKISTLHTNDVALGARIPNALSPITFLSYIKITGYHVSLVNFYSNETWENFRLMGGIGLSFLKAEAQRDTISVGRNLHLQYTSRQFKKQKTVIRLILAPEYRFKDNVGFRSSVCFIQTSKMKINAMPEGGSFTPSIRPKDSLIFSVGVFFEF